MSLDIVTFKWQQPGFRNKYTAEHVNRLYEMVKRNTSVKFRFTCVTDDPIDINPEIRTLPLWDNPKPTYGDFKKPNCFARLKMFSEEMRANFFDRIVWLDLDALIVGNMDPIFKEQADFRIWRVDREISLCNGSLVVHKMGTRVDLWDKFDPSKVDDEEGFRNTTGHVGSDQAWIAQNLRREDQFFAKADGVYSYRCHLDGKPLPPDARVVFFHGEEKPENLWHIGWIRRTLESLSVPPPENVEEKQAELPRKRLGKDSLRVVTWLWKPPRGKTAAFNASCVNTLLSMLDRYYKKPYELVCVTDMPDGIDASVRIIPLWDDFRNLEHPQLGRGFSQCYPRLKLFAPGMADIIAPRFVSMDLDVVMVSDITPLWDRKEDFVIWSPGHHWSPYNGSMWLMNADARPQVWKNFHPVNTPIKAKEQGFIGSDQAALASLLGPGEATWTDGDGVWAFRKLGHTEERKRRDRDNRHPDRERRNQIRSEREARSEARRASKRSLPPNTKMVFFPGPLKPWDTEVWTNFPWVRKCYKDIQVG